MSCLLAPDVNEAVHQVRVLIEHPTCVRQVIELDSLTHHEKAKRSIDGRRDLTPANKKIYLFAEAASPASRSTTCLRTS